MSDFNLIGPTYTAAAGNSDCQRTVNLYPEIVESGMGKGKVSLESTPGLLSANCIIPQTISGTLYSRINGIIVDQEKLWVIGCGSVWEWNGTTFTLRAPLALVGGVAHHFPDAASVSIASNGIELLICITDFGTVSYGVWRFNLSTYNVVFMDSTAYPDVYHSTQCAFIDGYFILYPPVNATTSRWDQKFYISALYDGSSWDPLDYASAEGNPDRIMAIIADHRELWLFGRQTTEIYVNTGASPFPFERIGGAVLDFGCIAYRSLCKLDNSLFFVGADQRGAGVVYRTNGYQAQRVSNHAVETSLNAAGVDLESCYAYSYTEAGHTFYCLTISASRATWVYDTVSGMWHERGAWNSGTGDFIALPFSSHAYHAGAHYVCGPTAESIALPSIANTYGVMYKQSLSYLNLDTQDVRRLRVTPHLSTEQAKQFYHSLQMDVECSAAGSVSPVINLDWSDDGGKTWSTLHTVTLPNTGSAGAQKFRAIWRRLGSGRDRVFRFYTESQVRWSFINGYLKATPGTGI